MSNTTIQSLATPSMEEKLIGAYGLTAFDIDAYKEEMDKTGPWWLDPQEGEAE